MFNETFYPTPREVIKEMLEDIRFDHKELILDPSAGKGDILDYLQERRYGHSYGYTNLFACEIVPELRAILEDKGYPVLADDFLTYRPTMYFTKIIMNPPFDHAEEHIFHAFDILGHGKVISLIPTTSLEGKYSKERVLLEMINNHGSVRSLGPVFRNAERPTSADISLVILEKEEDPFDLDFETVDEHAREFNFNGGPNSELTVPGFVPGLVAQYTAALGSVEEYLKARLQIEKYALRGHDDTDPINALDGGTPQQRYNGFVSRMNMLAWQKVLDHPNFQSILTDRARKMVKKFRARQQHLDFNVDNIMNMFRQIQQMAPDLLDAAIEDAFDEMTKWHKKNREAIEGWSTNIAWKVAPRVILPRYLDNTWSHKEGCQVSYQYRTALDDIDRAMCVISGKPFANVVKISDAIQGAGFGEQVYSTFFEMRGYKKGTLHLKFRDQKLLDDFNYRVAAGKGWLPDGTQTRYKV